jgi:hypothetical protein
MNLHATGGPIVATGWVANVLFLVTAVPAVLTESDTVEAVAIATALLLFFVGIGAFTYAFVVAVARTTRGDNVVVANLFFLQGSAPRSVQRDFLVLFLVALVIAAATAAWEPFGVLVPMLPIGLAGTWAARHGTFPPRPPAPRRTRA